MQDEPSIPRLVSIISSIGLPLPPTAITASGLASHEEVDAARASGHLILHASGDLMVNPLRPSPRESPGTLEGSLVLLAAARELAPHRIDLLVEQVRTIAQTDPSKASELAARVCRHARTAGRSAELAKLLLERSVVDVFLRLSRRDVLCCLIEAGWSRMVETILQPDEPELHARIACRENRFDDAQRAVAETQSAEACLVRARIALSRVSSTPIKQSRAPISPAELLQDADTILKSINQYPVDFSQQLEAALLRHKRSFIAMDWPQRDAAAKALKELAQADGDPYIEAHIIGMLIRSATAVADVPTAEQHLTSLKACAEENPSPKATAMIQYGEAIIGVLTGNHARLAATVLNDPRDRISPSFLPWELMSALEHWMRGELITATDIMRKLPFNSIRLDLSLQIGLVEEARRLVEKMGSDADRITPYVVAQMHRLEGKPCEPIAPETHIHQLYVGRMLFNASLQMDAGDFAGADETCQAALQRVRRYHLWQLGVSATVQRADLAARCGKAEAALELLDRAETHPLHPMSFDANRISTARSILADRPLPLTMITRIARQRDYRSIAMLDGAGVALPAIARTLLDSVLPTARQLASKCFQAVTSSDAILVELEGRWFRVPGSPPVSLARYGSTRRILVALAEARLHDPGRRLDADTLIEAGWPGDRLLPMTAQTRLYTAIRKLRKLGLEGILQTTSDGYRLSPRQPISRVRGRMEDVCGP